MNKKYISLLLFGMILLLFGTGCTKTTAVISSETQTPRETIEQANIQGEWNIADSSGKIDTLLSPVDYVGKTVQDDVSEWKWKKSEKEASLKYLQKSWYITYNTGTQLVQEQIQDTIVDRVMDTLFYEVDITGDGKDELVAVFYRATGSGSSIKSMFIYDMYHNTEIQVFDDSEPHNTTFTEMQKDQILSTMTEWYGAGFNEKNGWNEDVITTLNTTMFIPSIVNWNGTVGIKVGFQISGMESNSKLSSDYFSAVFCYSENEFCLEKMFYK